jgi:sulfate adenylyltransferase subunit 1
MSQGVLRFITAGSVDDGKSTLIGRLLYDTKAVLVDQLQALGKTKHARVTATDAAIDLALLTDGLEAEREQGITIDVAYRYFATAKRKFIVADAPGHEQYTRNLVTGASQTDVAVILVDVTRVDLSGTEPVLLAQTKRHSAIVKLLGLRHVAFALNKMDLVGFDEQVFNQISKALLDLSKTLGLPHPQIIPVSALQGDNVVTLGSQTPWYKGPPLLTWLEALDIQGGQEKATQNSGIGLRFPIQYVARQDGSANDDFRGYLGRIESGTISRGQKITILPSGLSATVSEIHISNDHQSLPSAEGVSIAKAGQVVAIRLQEDVDVSRGDMIVASEDTQTLPQLAKQLSADLCWLDNDDLSLSRKYVLRHTTNTVFAKIKAVDQVLDVQTLSHATENHPLRMNEIGRLQMTLQKPIVCDGFDRLAATGAFVLIDEASNHTVAAGMIREVLA